MADLYDVDDQAPILDGVDDSECALADAVPLLSGELSTSGGTGILGQIADPADDTLTIDLATHRLDLLGGRRLDQPRYQLTGQEPAVALLADCRRSPDGRRS